MRAPWRPAEGSGGGVGAALPPRGGSGSGPQPATAALLRGQVTPLRLPSPPLQAAPGLPIAPGFAAPQAGAPAPTLERTPPAAAPGQSPPAVAPPDPDAFPYADFNSSGNLTERYLFGHAVINGAVVDELLARTSSGGTTAWYLPDKLGSVRDIVNTSGSVIDHAVLAGPLGAGLAVRDRGGELAFEARAFFSGHGAEIHAPAGIHRVSDWNGSRFSAWVPGRPAPRVRTEVNG